ncbi:MAG: DUF2127 domain-containing protein [Acidobacteria bacterium]|nr:DUF2127 domain-containing protein [Acidobacteriota bacterium]
MAFTLGPTSKPYHLLMHVGLETESTGARVESRGRIQALRAIAAMEFAKGVAVLAAAISLRWVDPTDVVGGFLGFLHVSPDHHIAQLLLRSADIIGNASLRTVVLLASLYSGLRFAEAFGLWRARAWAEWIALISGAVYLPFEVYQLVHRVSLLHASILLINLAVVVFMFYLRIYLPRLEKSSVRVR